MEKSTQENPPQKAPKEPKTKPKPLDAWLLDGIPCHYVRFHQPVPPALNKEPVSEFYIKSVTGKYVVDSIVYTERGLIWKAFGETNIVPLANITHVRT